MLEATTNDISVKSWKSDRPPFFSKGDKRGIHFKKGKEIVPFFQKRIRVANRR
jgi:hypothetical protein